MRRSVQMRRRPALPHMLTRHLSVPARYGISRGTQRTPRHGWPGGTTLLRTARQDADSPHPASALPLYVPATRQPRLITTPPADDSGVPGVRTQPAVSVFRHTSSARTRARFSQLPSSPRVRVLLLLQLKYAPPRAQCALPGSGSR